MNQYFWYMTHERAKLNEYLYKELKIKRRRSLPDAAFDLVWQELEREGYVEDHLEDGVAQIADLADEAEKTSAYKAAMGKSGRKPTEVRSTFSVALSQYAEGRARMISKALAIQATNHELVREFRNEVLKGTLTPESAHRFVDSPATQFFLKQWFDKWKIPFVEHSASVVATDAGLPGFKKTSPEFMDVFGPPERYVRVQVDSPSVTKSILYASRDKEVHESVPVDERLFLPMVDEAGARPMENVVSYPWNDAVHRVRVFPNSLLDIANGIALLLAARYNWTEHEALWFLLTGEIPKMDPLQLTFSLLIGSEQSSPVWDVTLKVAPWMPPKEVAAAFRELQVQILGSTSEGNRFKTESKPDIFEFVLDQGVLPDAEDDFSGLFNQWKQKHADKGAPKAAYTSRKSRFKKAFEEVERAYLKPNYNLPRREPQNDLEQWEEEDLLRRRQEVEAELQRIDFFLEGGTDEDI